MRLAITLILNTQAKIYITQMGYEFSPDRPYRDIYGRPTYVKQYFPVSRF